VQSSVPMTVTAPMMKNAATMDVGMTALHRTQVGYGPRVTDTHIHCIHYCCIALETRKLEIVMYISYTDINIFHKHSL
jgi:hypothetical protein